MAWSPVFSESRIPSSRWSRARRGRRGRARPGTGCRGRCTSSGGHRAGGPTPARARCASTAGPRHRTAADRPRPDEVSAGVHSPSAPPVPRSVRPVRTRARRGQVARGEVDQSHAGHGVRLGVQVAPRRRAPRPPPPVPAAGDVVHRERHVAAASSARGRTSRAGRGRARLREPTPEGEVPAQPPVHPQRPAEPGRRVAHRPRGRARRPRSGWGARVDPGQGSRPATVPVAGCQRLRHGQVVLERVPLRPPLTRPPPAAGRGRTAPPAPAAGTAGPTRRPGRLTSDCSDSPPAARASDPQSAASGDHALDVLEPEPIHEHRQQPEERLLSRLSSPWLQSRVARRLRCRSGRSRAPASRRVSSRSSSAPGSSSRARAAASSSASGMPARRTHIAATAAVRLEHRPPARDDGPARSSSSRAAGLLARHRAGRPRGSTATSASPRTRSGARLVASTVSPGAA